MLRHLFACVLIVGGAVTLNTTSIQAQTVNLPFSGTMPTNCTFGTPIPGVLAPNGTNRLTTDSGSRGSVTLNCLAPANITITAPIQTGGLSFSPTSCTAEFYTVGDQRAGTLLRFQSCSGTSPAKPINGSQTLSVGMSVMANSGIPPGEYSYNVTLTITP